MIQLLTIVKMELSNYPDFCGSGCRMVMLWIGSYWEWPQPRRVLTENGRDEEWSGEGTVVMYSSVQDGGDDTG